MPQKKAQIVMAKKQQEPARKRGRQAPPTDPNNIMHDDAVRKPLLPTGFNFMSVHGRGQPPQGGAVRSSQDGSGQGRLSTLSAGSVGVKGVAVAAKASKGSGPVGGPTHLSNGQKKPQTQQAALLRAKAPPPLHTKSSGSSGGSAPPPRKPTVGLQSRPVPPGDSHRHPTAPSRRLLELGAAKRLQAGADKRNSGPAPSSSPASAEAPPHQERASSKVTEMSAGEDASSSADSEEEEPTAMGGEGAGSGRSQDWKPPRSLIEHVFVTDVTANLVTVTVKESPTSVGFFSIRNY